MIFSHKKIFSFFLTLLSVIGYGVVVFATQLPALTAPPPGGYTAGNSILDPGCAPGGANCFQNTGIYMGQGVVSGTPSQVLYLNNAGQLAGDDDFTRDGSSGATILVAGNAGLNFDTSGTQLGYINNGGGPVARYVANTTGNTLSWDADTTDTIVDYIIQNQNLLGFGLIGNGMIHRDTSSSRFATAFVGDDGSSWVANMTGNSVDGDIQSSVSATDSGTKGVNMRFNKASTNTLSGVEFLETGNMMTWDADTTDTIIDGLLQGNNLNGVGYKGNALAHYDTGTYESAAFFAGDTTSTGGKPYEASMTYVIPGGINGSFGYVVNSDGLKAEYNDIVGNIKSDILQEATGTSLIWDADTTDIAKTGLYQGQALFGLPIVGTASGYSDNDFTTSMSGIISGDFSGIGSADNAVMSGFVSFTGGAMASDHYSYDLATDTARIEMKAVSSTNMAQVRVKVIGTTQEIVFDYGGGDKYTFPVGDGTTNFVLATDGSGQMYWADVSVLASDASLKSNIQPLAYGLDTLMRLNPVSYTLNSTGNQQIGFIAQEVEPIIPELIGSVADGKKGLRYGQLTSVIVKSVQELGLKVATIENFTTSVDHTFVSQIIAWLGSATNGIENIFTKKVTTEQICVTDAGGETCLNRSQVNQLLNTQSQSGTTGGPQLNNPPTPDPTPTPDPAPTPDPTPTGDGNVTSTDGTPNTPPSDNPPTENPPENVPLP